MITNPTHKHPHVECGICCHLGTVVQVFGLTVFRLRLPEFVQSVLTKLESVTQHVCGMLAGVRFVHEAAALGDLGIRFRYCALRMQGHLVELLCGVHWSQTGSGLWQDERLQLDSELCVCAHMFHL